VSNTAAAPTYEPGLDLGRRRSPSRARQFVNLTFALAVAEFKLRYFGSVLGYLWTLARPLMLFGVLYLVFTQFVRFGEGVAHYPAYLLSAIVLWHFFAEATSGSVKALVARDAMVRKMSFPLLAIPLSVSLTAMFNLALNLVVVIFFVLISGVDPKVTWIEWPVMIALIVVLATGCSAGASALYVRYRDMDPIWEVVLQLGFWGSAIIYTIQDVPSQLFQKLMLINPVAAVNTQVRHAVIDSDAPGMATFFGTPLALLIPIAVAAIVLAAGLYTFHRMSPRIAEEL
jgi:ABC-2 type transport system permease protein